MKKIQPKPVIQFLCAIVGALAFAAPALAQLPPTNHLAAWFDVNSLNLANGAPVTSWVDRSGNGYNASITATIEAGGYHPPTFLAGGFNGHSGLTAVRFDSSTAFQSLFINPGTNYVFNTGFVPLASGLTIAAVFQASSPGPGNGVGGIPNFSNLIGDTARGAAVTAFGLENGVPGFVRYAPGNVNASGPGYVNLTGGSSLLTGTAQSLLVTEDSSGAANLYANGGLVGSENMAPYNAFTEVSQLGNGYNGSGVFNGLISQILIYDAPLTGSDLVQLNQYLASAMVIPEPSSVVLLGLGAFVLWRRRR